METRINCLDKLAMLRHFPSKTAVVAEIGKLVDEICADDTEAQLLTDAVLEQFSEWPGPGVLRQAYAEKVASHRAEMTPGGCATCGGTGLRQTCRLHEWLPDGSQRKQVIRPEGTAHEIHQQIWALRLKYQGSKTHEFYDACSEPCSCPRGRHYAERLANRRNQDGPYVRD
jgi:type II secretory ATPase GspE/PulE/Tfp pilus assembly ATPase PilB-like protein